MTTYLSQLKQIGVFEKVNGIILGRFIEMENKCCIPTIIDLVKRYINRDLPLVKTSEVGHNIDSKVPANFKKHLIFPPTTTPCMELP